VVKIEHHHEGVCNLPCFALSQTHIDQVFLAEFSTTGGGFKDQRICVVVQKTAAKVRLPKVLLEFELFIDNLFQLTIALVVN